MAAASAATDRLDPRWHWEDLSDHRAIVPDDQNAAPVVLETAKLLPENWPPQPPLEFPGAEEKTILDKLREIDSGEPIGLDLIKTVRAELQKVELALHTAHRLAAFRTGRYRDLSFEDYHFRTRVDHLHQCRQVANLLWLDALMLAQEGKAQAALDSSRCLLIAGRSIGDEPGVIAHLIRNSCCQRTVLSIERTLARGEPAEEDLAATQQLLEGEQAQNTLLMALRGQRAFQDQVMSWVDADDRDRLDPGLGGNELARFSQEHPRLMACGHWCMVGWLKENHAVMLELTTEAVEIAKLPVDEQVERFEQLNRKARKVRSEGWPTLRYAFGSLGVPAVIKVAQSFARSRVELRCAVAGLAAERFRIAHGIWPKELDDLAPQFLTATPLDLFDGKQLKLRRFDDGMLIYSVGPDGADHGGKVNRKLSPSEPQDFGFRLWDVARRRQDAKGGGLPRV
ncbi:MAG TPA: hypothetical protein VGY66_21725 [Gemmataceae bacterium]|nr:hypothetical protein [Gemmataceae bacterium]